MQGLFHCGGSAGSAGSRRSVGQVLDIAAPRPLGAWRGNAARSRPLNTGGILMHYPGAMKMFKKIVLATLVAVSVAGPLASYAQVIVNVPPPAARHEVVPAPRHGSVWVPGHYEWRQQHHVWVSGHWIKARPG